MARSEERGREAGVSPDTTTVDPTLERDQRRRRPERLSIAILLVGLVVTVIGAGAAARTDHNAERRLLEVQTRQAATVLGTAIGNIQQPLVAALDVQAAVPPTPADRRAAFSDRFGRNVGEDSLFLNATLWRHTADGGFAQVAHLGTQPGLPDSSTRLGALLRRAMTSSTAVVDRVTVGAQTRIAYGLADNETGLVVYAERAIPADRRAPVDRDSAYSGLDYAIYLGPKTDDDHLTTTDVAPADLPLTGLTYKTTVPFGDTVLTLETRPRDHLGSDLGRLMPWLVLLGGLVLTALGLAVARQVLASRARAENDTRTITALYRRVDGLYGEQRDLSIQLQRALLPRIIPEIPGTEIAADYVAGARGIDIGGDWYSVIGLGEDEFAFVVGDVSGHGIDAVAEMARARFTVRAYLADGSSPDEALAKCARQFDILVDGHIVTVVAGVGNWRTGEITLASAGHPAPLLVRGDGSTQLIDMEVGPPLGAGPAAFQAVSLALPLEATLVCYTDGLVERRNEDIDEGIERLARTASRVHEQNRAALRSFLTELLTAMRDDDRADDIAVLALRRTQPPDVQQ